MRVAFLTILLGSCSPQLPTTRPAELQKRGLATRHAPIATDAGSNQQSHASNNTQPAHTDRHSGTQAAAVQPEVQLTYATSIWVVIDKKCESIVFEPRDPRSGKAFILGYRLSYELHAESLRLHALCSSPRESDPCAACETVFYVGPHFSSLGGADVYSSESACRGELGSAVPLDDSRETTAKKCKGLPVLVTTNEVQCGIGGYYDVSWGRGCISSLRVHGYRQARTK